MLTLAEELLLLALDDDKGTVRWWVADGLDASLTEPECPISALTA
jgi:hypothetical protein